ncbi:MAG: metallophosphoesterase family protein [Nocardioidaceae bacterium]
MCVAAALVGVLLVALIWAQAGSWPWSGPESGGAPIAESSSESGETSDDIADNPNGEPIDSSVAGEPARERAHRPLVRLVAAGDTGTGDRAQRRTVAAMVDVTNGRPFDALLLLGDIVYDVGNPRLVPRTVTKPFAPLVRTGAELIPALGNHDIILGRQDEILHRLGRSDPYYVEHVGPLRVVVLDSNHVSEDQTAWLRRVLSADVSPRSWTVVIMHHPPYSAGGHGSSLPVRRSWSPLFERYDVPLVLAGHDHDYQRSEPIRDVTYVVSGGGATLRPTGSRPFTAVSASVLHFLDIAVYRDRLLVRAVDQSGGLVDRFALHR